ncbi:MAG TPA: GAF domain-containing sensor histidine kinase [Candidatus Limnocylindria bacterium]|nr:GAF domain-containing sensor histidine kinase [Candidatus Limnocylindria bacterium]
MSSTLNADVWATRMANLSKLARADGLAVVLEMKEDGFVTYVSDNIPSAAGWNGANVRPLLRRAFDGREASQAQVVLPLADGRAASSIQVTPIVWNDQLVGALAALRSNGAFGADESAEIASVADLIGLELSEANQLRRALIQQADLETRLRATTKIGELARRTRDPDRLLEKATSQLADLFRADGVSIMLADDAGQLSVRSSLGLSDAGRRDRKKVGEGISGHVALTGQPMLLSGEVRDQRFAGNDPSINESIIAPLRADDRTIGVVSIKHRSDQGRYGPAQMESLTKVASEIADAFVAAESLRRVEEDRRQALILYELSRLAALGNDPQNDLETAAAMLGDTLGHDVVGVWILESTGGLRFRAGRGYGRVLPDQIAAGALGPVMTAVVTNDRLEQSCFAERDPSRPEWAAAGALDFIVAPIGSHGNVLGALVLGRKTGGYVQADTDFAITLGEYLSGSLQKTTVGESPDVITANERRRIAQEIHDGIAQELTGVVLTLEGCQRALERDPSSVRTNLARAAREARATLAEVRQYMAALRQNEGASLSVPATLARLIDDVRRQTGLVVEVEEHGPERRLESSVERGLMRIVGESLRNVAQHAHAANAKVTLRYGDSDVAVTIEDDGAGFDLESTVATASERGRFGLAGMRERAEGLGGSLTVFSQAELGTIVRASLPDAAGKTPRMAEPTPVLEDVEQPAERTGLFGRFRGR